MHVLITGAAGFVGQALARRLQSHPHIGARPVSRLTLVDLAFHDTGAVLPGWVQRLAGNLADAEGLNAALPAAPLDAIFHLASIPGGMAEAQYERARSVNLDATLALLERGRRQVLAGGPVPVFVFASSIAVFGDLQAPVNDDTLPGPSLSYGAHKLVGEVLVNDFSRRGWVDGRSLRLPGVLARPPARTGQLSAFLSDMLREGAAGRPFTCPMSATATTWASSLPNTVDNLLHAAHADVQAWGHSRSVTLPTLRFSMAEAVQALDALYGPGVAARVSYAPQPHIEALFGRFPTLQTPKAEAVGLRADPDLMTLVQRALAA